MVKSKVSLKLLIETKGKRVLFVEASKDCVEFLFYLLSLPLATVICLIGEEGMEGSLTTLYKSLDNLNDTFIQTNQKKNTYLKPVMPVFGSSVQLPAFEGSSSSGKNTYKCNNCTTGYAYDSQRSCPSCGHEMSLEDGGLVKGVVTYMVMEELV